MTRPTDPAALANLDAATRLLTRARAWIAAAKTGPRARCRYLSQLADGIRGCRYLNGDLGDPAAHFCAAPTTSIESAWCAEHQKRVYISSPNTKVRP